MPIQAKVPESLSIAERIAAEVGSWPGVTMAAHRFGGTEFRLGRVELGHLHGDRLADLPFPRRIRDELIAEGRAEPHHVLPDTGWVSRRIASEDEVPEVVALFRLNYARYARRRPAAHRREAHHGGSPHD